MDAKGPKGCSTVVLTIFILALLLSTSSAGGQRRFLDKHALPVRSPAQEAVETSDQFLNEEQATAADAASFVPRSRILKVNTNDYASYDPSPTLDKPPFKLIPN